MNAIYNAAQSMKKHTFPRKTSSLTKPHDKPWFDTECDQHRKEAISALKTFRIVKSITALDHYKSVKNVYKNVIKSKKSEYLEKRSSMLSEAASDKNPKAFWTSLKSDREPRGIDIAFDDWFKYFSNLLNPDQQDIFQNEHINQDHPPIENECLDSPITENEVLQVIKNLKTRKSPGIDGLNIQFYKSCTN